MFTAETLRNIENQEEKASKTSPFANQCYFGVFPASIFKMHSDTSHTDFSATHTH